LFITQLERVANDAVVGRLFENFDERLLLLLQGIGAGRLCQSRRFEMQRSSPQLVTSEERVATRGSRHLFAFCVEDKIRFVGIRAADGSHAANFGQFPVRALERHGVGRGRRPALAPGPFAK